jgi:hypothetical protein
MTEELVRQEPGDLERYDVDTGTYGEEQTELDKLLERSAELREKATPRKWLDERGSIGVSGQAEGERVYKAFVWTDSPGDSRYIAHEYNTSESKDRIIRVLVEAAEGVAPYLEHSMDPPESVPLVFLSGGTALRRTADALDAKDRAVRKFRAALAEVESIAGEANKA